jgi:hypothetical protein
MGSMHTGLEESPDGFERMAAFFAERAKGGAGLIVTGGFAPNLAGRGSPKASQLSFPWQAASTASSPTPCTPPAARSACRSCTPAATPTTRWRCASDQVADQPVRAARAQLAGA